MVCISNSGPPHASAAFIFCSPCPGIFAKVSLIIDVNLSFLLLLSIVAIIIASALAFSSNLRASVPINNIFVIPGCSLYSIACAVGFSWYTCPLIYM